MGTQSGKNAFVFAVVGDAHVAAVNVALAFLKRFSRAEIIVLQARSAVRAAHDRVIEVDLPGELDDHQAAIVLKTSVLAHVAGMAERFCYLDSDVIAVRDDVDTIFDHLEGPVRFAADHVNIDGFSRWAVNCGCRENCHHLREAILCDHAVEVRQTDWRLWNGGVFLFDDRAGAFLDTWRAMVMQNFTDPYWRTRDQGALAATVWRHGLEGQALLPSEFNFIVDRMWGVPVARRAQARTEDFHLRDDYALDDAPHDGRGRAHPRLIHFINGGVGQDGWRHWDEVKALLAAPLRAALGTEVAAA